jgi:5-dehydro-2-deoxygluconokinase
MCPPDEPEFLMYREPDAPDTTISPDEVDHALVKTVPILWISGGALAVDPSRRTVRSLLATRARRPHVVLDLDYRASLWRAPEDARRELVATFEAVTVVVGNTGECGIALGTTDPEAAADRILNHGVELAIVKLGAEGALVATADERLRVPPVSVQVVSGLGAGDAFGGALCVGLLRGWSAVATVEFANAAGALVASRLLCADAMPTEDEVRELLQAVPG